MTGDIIIDSDEEFSDHIDACIDRAEEVYPFVRSLLHDEYDVTIAMTLSALIAEVLFQSDISIRDFILEKSIDVLLNAMDEAEDRDDERLAA